MIPLARASRLADQEEPLRQHLGLDGVGADGSRAEQIGLGRRAGRGVDQMVKLAPGAAPAAPVAARRGESAAGELDRHRAVDADRPRSAAHGDVTAGVDEAGAGLREQLGRPVDRIALPDPAEVEADTRVELDSRADQPDAAAAAGGACCPGGVSWHELERAVVARRDDGVVNGRVEASVRSVRALRGRARRRAPGPARRRARPLG